MAATRQEALALAFTLCLFCIRLVSYYAAYLHLYIAISLAKSAPNDFNEWTTNPSSNAMLCASGFPLHSFRVSQLEP